MQLHGNLLSVYGEIYTATALMKRQALSEKDTYDTQHISLKHFCLMFDEGPDDPNVTVLTKGQTINGESCTSSLMKKVSACHKSKSE